MTRDLTGPDPAPDYDRADPAPDYDRADPAPATFPRPGNDGPARPLVEAAQAWEADHARGGWDQQPRLLWVRHPPDGPPTLSPLPAPAALLQDGPPWRAATHVAQTLARLGPAAALIVPLHLAAVAMVCEAWAVRRPDDDDPELDHLLKLRDHRKLWTRPERTEQRYVNIVDLGGNEADVIRDRGTGGHPDRVHVQQWAAGRIAGFYRGEALVALRRLAAVLAAGPPRRSPT